MIRARRAALLAASVMSVVALDACRKKPVVAPTPAPTVNQDSINAANAARARQDSIDAENARRAAAERARQDSIARANAAASEAMNSMRSALTAVVHFNFDRSDILPEAQATLDAKLPVLQANPNVRIRIEGHADERGSDEYNMALGMRRATAAKRYLTDKGIDAGRIDVASFGEERPVCQQSEESCWSQNRRDEFVIVAGGDNLVRTR